MSTQWNKLKTDQLRKARGLDYGDLARALKPPRTRQAVGHWFRDRGEPDMVQIKQMAARLGVHWLELVNETAVVVNDPVESDFLNDYRNASPEDQEMARRFLRSLKRVEH